MLIKDLSQIYVDNRISPNGKIYFPNLPLADKEGFFGFIEVFDLNRERLKILQKIDNIILSSVKLLKFRLQIGYLYSDEELNELRTKISDISFKTRYFHVPRAENQLAPDYSCVEDSKFIWENTSYISHYYFDNIRGKQPLYTVVKNPKYTTWLGETWDTCGGAYENGMFSFFESDTSCKKALSSRIQAIKTQRYKGLQDYLSLISKNSDSPYTSKALSQEELSLLSNIKLASIICYVDKTGKVVNNYYKITS